LYIKIHKYYSKPSFGLGVFTRFNPYIPKYIFVPTFSTTNEISTNPCIHTPLLDNDNHDNENDNVNIDNDNNDDIDDLNGKGWILDGLPTSHLQSNSHHRLTRILRYRRKVGTGVECYTKLRNIALQWEGLHQHSHWAGVKLLPPPSSTLSTPLAPLPFSLSPNLHQIFSDPGGRTLITYSRIGPSRYSPVWAMNPCGVVYDIVDDHSRTMMYSSTAYATLRGHYCRNFQKKHNLICWHEHWDDEIAE